MTLLLIIRLYYQRIVTLLLTRRLYDRDAITDYKTILSTHSDSTID